MTGGAKAAAVRTTSTVNILYIRISVPAALSSGHLGRRENGGEADTLVVPKRLRELGNEGVA